MEDALEIAYVDPFAELDPECCAALPIEGFLCDGQCCFAFTDVGGCLGGKQ